MAMARDTVDGGADDDVDYGAPEHLKVRTNEELEAKLIEGMAGPAREMTAADWDEMERRLIERHSQLRQKPSV